MSGGPPRNSHPSRYAGRPSAQDDLNWLEHIRTAGGTVRNDYRPPPQLDRNNSSSSDRKRRHTGSEPQRRTHPHPNHAHANRSTTSTSRPSFDYHATNNNNTTSHTATSSIPGSSMDNAIDLTTPPRSARPAGPGTSLISRMVSDEREDSLNSRDGNSNSRESEFVLPRWQPDHEAVACPVCDRMFGIFYRRHHCRKCGRVVCSNCSPHKIRIPQQFTVRPPDEGNQASPDNPALGGGQVVRLCNPCVPDPQPDPWSPDADTTTNARPDPRVNRPTTSAVFDGVTSGLMTNPHSVRCTKPRRPEEDLPPGAFQHLQPGRYRSHTGPQSRSEPRLEVVGDDTQARMRRAGLLSPGLAERVQRNGGYRDGELYPSRPSRHPPPVFGSAPPSHVTPPSQVAPPSRVAPPTHVPRSQAEVQEDDECPVCGCELPPGEATRERHVKACVDSRFSSSSAPFASAPADSAFPSGNSSSNLPEGSRPRATSYRPRGMALYRATEKDCVNANGETQECVICFEEFEEGDEMGRMECFCKFHRACIRQWWEKKGAGSCPTHRLYE